MRHRKHAADPHQRSDGCSGRLTPMSPAASAAGEGQTSDGTPVVKRPASAEFWRLERLVEIVLGMLVMGVYLKTLYPSVAGGDSGELVAESCHLGVSHPPGYPLFNMMVHAVTTYLPTPHSKAWKANAFSAACDTLASIMMYRTILLWTSMTSSRAHRTLAAFTASALFAFSPLIWTYAISAEVFALNNLFAAALLHTLLQYSIDRSLSLVRRGALLCGLAMCNQHTIILFEVPLVVWVLWTRRDTLLTGRELADLSLAFAIGLLPYAYMPITATWNAQPGSWGDVTTLSGFFHHLRRADYGTFRLYSTTSQTTEDMWTRLRLYSVDLSTREVPLRLAFPIAIGGALASCSLGYIPQRSQLPNQRANINTNGVGRLVVAMYLFYMVVFHALANLPLNEGLLYGVHMRFWQQPNIIVFVWIGVGFKTILDGIDRVPPRFVSVLSRLAVVGLVAVQLARWYDVSDQSEAFFIRDYASALLDPLPHGAVLFVNFDLQWTSLRYLQRCESRRPDVTILNYSMMTYHWFETKQTQYPHLVFPGARLVPYGSLDGFSFAQFLQANSKFMKSRRRGGIFFGGKLTYDDPDMRESFAFIPYGLVDEIRPIDAKSQSLQSWYATQQRVRQLVRERLPQLPPAIKYDDETWEWTIARDHGMKQLSWSTYLLERTIAEDPHNLTLLAASTHAMEHSYQLEPRQFWTASSNLKNLGLAYAQIVKSKEEFASGEDPFYNAVVGSGVEDPTRYKDRASSRMLEVWHAWLQVPEARNDPGYDAIRGVVNQFLPDSRPTSSSSTQAKKKKKSKKKAKRRTA